MYYVMGLNLTQKVVSDLNPGIKATDVEVFEVSETAFSPDTWGIKVDGGENVRVSLNKN